MCCVSSHTSLYVMCTVVVDSEVSALVHVMFAAFEADN